MTDDLRQLDASLDALATTGNFDALAALLADDFKYTIPPPTATRAADRLVGRTSSS